MKKYLLAFILCFMFIGSVSAREISGTVKVFWYDYDNYLKDRPSEITLPVDTYKKDENADSRELTLKLNDNCTSNRRDEDLTIWNCNVSFESFTPLDYMYSFSGAKFSVSGYDYDKANSGGSVSSEFLGSEGISVYLFKNSAKILNININYHDDNGRDKENSRSVYFELKATNADYSYEYEFGNENPKGDSYTELDSISGLITNDRTSEDFLKRVEYEVVEKLHYSNRKVEYNYDNENGVLTIDLYYSAKKIDVPFKLKWNDTDESKRPKSIKLVAYNQNDKVEDEFDITEDTTLSLFENLKYSYGTKIDYTFKAIDDDNYTYEVTKEDDTYIITGTYHEDKVMEKSENIENPTTNDNIIIYVSALIVCTIVIALTVRKIKK